MLLGEVELNMADGACGGEVLRHGLVAKSMAMSVCSLAQRTPKYGSPHINLIKPSVGIKLMVRA